MSRTFKDKNKNLRTKIGVSKQVKKEAKSKRGSYKLEDNRRALRLESADEWSWD